MDNRRYVPHIDGLRALAITPVVLYHAGISIFSGGFVGVDIFFVISGYLITGIILRNLQTGTFSILGFYERRIRRIFPALFAMIAFVCIVSPMALLPSELRKLPIEIVGALTFVANIVFWRQSNYFATSAEEKPLLHTWSLGVEEQFYIFAPLMLWLIIRYAPRTLPLILVTCLILSFSLCVWFTPSEPSPSFYLLPFRAWELLVGSVLATGIARSAWRPINEGLAGLGLVAILAAIFLIDAKTQFPGYAAALPVVGAALILQFGPGSLTGRLLSNRLPVLVGLLSYSLYLWHWPLIVFFRDWGLLDNTIGRLGVVAISFIIAWLSWKFIETPFRRNGNWPRKKLFVFAASGTAVLLVAAGVLWRSDGWPSRFSPQAVAFDSARDDISPERKRCHIGDGDRPFAELCRLNADIGTEPSTIVWSDSHGVEISAAMAEAGLPLIQASYSACPPALGFYPPERPDCAAHNLRILEAIKAEPEIHTVVLIAYYLGYDDPALWTGLRRTIDTVQASGRKVIVLGPVPNFKKDIPSYLSGGFGSALPPEQVPPEFNRVTESVPVISLIDMLCPGGVCPLVVNNKPLLFDTNHISITAARSIAAKLLIRLGR